MERRRGGSDPATAATRIVVRPIANPLPLGFLALAGGTLLVSGLQLEWLAAPEGDAVALALIAFVFPLQLVAAVFGFLGRDVVAGTGMGVLAGTWLTVGLVTLTGSRGVTSDALGLLLLIAAAAMLVPALASATHKLAVTAVLATTALRFAATGLYELTAAGAWRDVAGLIGVLLCALAFYVALAMALEDARGATVLPLARRGSGATAISGGLGEQVSGVEGEVGVRKQI
jgi:uncharacterized protein